jgi:hypothetical protein
MRIGARILRAVNGVNSYEYAQEFEHNELSQNTLYIQLVNLDHNRDGEPHGIPYQPAAGSTLSITLPSIDANAVVNLAASQPFSEDASIWSAAILDTHDFATGNLYMSLTESGVVKNIIVENGLIVFPSDPSRC